MIDLPSRCHECGVLLQGGATRHKVECFWYPLSYIGIVDAEEMRKGKTYEVVADCLCRPFIRCLKCGSESYNPNDIEKLYCGHCHRFHERQQ